MVICSCILYGLILLFYWLTILLGWYVFNGIIMCVTDTMQHTQYFIDKRFQLGSALKLLCIALH